tara:strand:+ start:529 stop:999 length:471 start_codon:yes stop_codon:yes gene_type:complete
MNDIYLNIYNNLIKLTRNKNLYNNNKQDTFYERMIIFFFHLSFLLKIFKNIETKNDLQNFFDYTIRQIELSIREVGYGDATINKKMKDYINILFSIIDKIDKWEDLDAASKTKIIKYFIEDNSLIDNYVQYFEKYIQFLRKNTFNSLSKDILSLKN